MKVFQLIESNIIDFAREKEQRQLSSRLKTITDHENLEFRAMNEFQQLEEWIDKIKHKATVPGFKDLNSIINFLITEIKLPPRIRTTQETARWIDKLTKRQRDQSQMIVAHVPRLLKRYKLILDTVLQFKTKWNKIFLDHTSSATKFPQLDAIDYADYVIFEIQGDMNALIVLTKIISRE